MAYTASSLKTKLNRFEVISVNMLKVFDSHRRGLNGHYMISDVLWCCLSQVTMATGGWLLLLMMSMVMVMSAYGQFSAK